MPTKKKSTGKRQPSKTRTAWLPKVGEQVFIRTVTHYYTGRITAMEGGWIALDDAAWIADTGRFHQALESGSLNEVEPFPGGCAVAVGSVVDCTPWPHSLPRSTK